MLGEVTGGSDVESVPALRKLQRPAAGGGSETEVQAQITADVDSVRCPASR
jgi:hypothetical protein